MPSYTCQSKRLHTSSDWKVFAERAFLKNQRKLHTRAIENGNRNLSKFFTFGLAKLTYFSLGFVVIFKTKSSSKSAVALFDIEVSRSIKKTHRLALDKLAKCPSEVHLGPSCKLFLQPVITSRRTVPRTPWSTQWLQEPSSGVQKQHL